MGGQTINLRQEINRPFYTIVHSIRFKMLDRIQALSPVFKDSNLPITKQDKQQQKGNFLISNYVFVLTIFQKM